MLNRENDIGACTKGHELCHAHASGCERPVTVSSGDEGNEFSPVVLAHQPKGTVLMGVADTLFAGGVGTGNGQVVQGAATAFLMNRFVFEPVLLQRERFILSVKGD